MIKCVHSLYNYLAAVSQPNQGFASGTKRTVADLPCSSSPIEADAVATSPAYKSLAVTAPILFLPLHCPYTMNPLIPPPRPVPPRLLTPAYPATFRLPSSPSVHGVDPFPPPKLLPSPVLNPLQDPLGRELSQFIYHIQYSSWVLRDMPRWSWERVEMGLRAYSGHYRRMYVRGTEFGKLNVAIWRGERERRRVCDRVSIKSWRRRECVGWLA